MDRRGKAGATIRRANTGSPMRLSCPKIRIHRKVAMRSSRPGESASSQARSRLPSGFVLATLIGPRPTSVLLTVKNGVVEIAGLTRLATMENGDWLLGQQIEHAPRLFGSQQRADPIEKGELGLSQKNAGEGEQLLLARGAMRAEVLLAIEFAVQRNQRFEAKQPQDFGNPLVCRGFRATIQQDLA